MINIDDRLLAEVTPNELWLLVHITKRVGQNSSCFPSNLTLMSDTGWKDERTLRGVKSSLLEKGLIEQCTRTRENGAQTSNLTTLKTTKISIMMPPAKDAPPPPAKDAPPPPAKDAPLSINKLSINKEKGDCPAFAEPPIPSELLQPLKEKQPATDSDGRRAAATRVVEYLNQKALRNFPVNGKMSTATLKSIVARLNDGCTEEQFKLVIDNRCSAWLGDAKMSAYLRPSTLFSATNFVNYLEEATRSSGGTNNGTVYDVQLSDERKKSYDKAWAKILELYPKTAASVRFFTASEYIAFYAEQPSFSPKIWEKYQGDFRASKTRQALTELENSSSKSKLAPTGLCDYLIQWFLDERDGKH